ncbi:hypothetical protein [Sorangium atrum]|uniref:Uncharacterized protein n=1 Tax=Sorangium atrum TaxID=2995308 RepID=A0ABT5BXX6_9BACT|nr:hypothetical protein [Sorangium aterium]MDC0679006.1 hypothetical protein [Sorangium aterium]
MGTIQIAAAESQINAGEAVLDNNLLANALVQNAGESVRCLGDQADAKVYLSDLSIDKRGRVVVKNSNCTNALSQKLAGQAAAGQPWRDIMGTNSVCGYRC